MCRDVNRQIPPLSPDSKIHLAEMSTENNAIDFTAWPIINRQLVSAGAKLRPLQRSHALGVIFSEISGQTR